MCLFVVMLTRLVRRLEIYGYRTNLAVRARELVPGLAIGCSDSTQSIYPSWSVALSLPGNDKNAALDG